jgi:outer membrane protein insertion porin family
MKWFRLKSLPARAACLWWCAFAPLAALSQEPAGPQPGDSQAGAQQPAPPPEPPAPAKQSPPQQKKQNPFESIPVEQAKPPAPQAPKPAGPIMEAPKPAVEPPKPTPETAVEDIVEAIEFRGARRVPQDTLRALIFTKKGDKYDEEALQRDFMALWNTGRFDDIRLEREAGTTGWIIRFQVTERRIVRSIKYDGMKSITVSEILDRFKERKVGLSVEQQYDPNKVQRARNVLAEYLAERGRQFATVTPEVRQVPPSSLEVVFKVDEGPKVKVGDIKIEGNKVFSDREVIRAMRNLKPVGIPRSILFENLFAKTFDSTKLEEDKQRIQNFYQEKGYFLARANEHELTIRDVGGQGMKIPLFYPNKPGKRADLSVTVDEGRLYLLNKMNFVGVKLFKTPETVFPAVFQMKEGDVFSTAKLRKGIEELRKLYGSFGYIDMVPEPGFDPIPNSNKIDMTLSIEEGKQFFVRRIDFSGNTTTRDKVIRRELLIDEGDMFNTRLWELSILRLNQLGYFEVLKEGESADIKRDTRTNTVDITLKVKERGRNSVQLNGGVSGIAGSFIGFSYATNNFLGLGETLSIATQLGDRTRDVTFSFTEPYFLDKPIQVGFTVFYQRFNYDQGREVSLLSGRNLTPIFNQLGTQNLLNYTSNSRGGTVFASYPLRRWAFGRLGLSYGYNVQNIQPLTDAARTYFEFLNFQNVGGPNSLEGIRSSQLIPSFTYNTVNHPITPTQGKSFFISVPLTGGPMGGNVNALEPTLDVKYFRGGFKRGHVIGFHFLGRFITGFSDRVAPPYSRFFMGGENDVRGFQIWGISPVAYIPSSGDVPVYNNDGTLRQQKAIIDGQEQFVPVTQRVPFYQLISPGGDTQGVFNFEYRIPIFGPVTLAAFLDAGVNRISRPSQLTLNPGRVNQLNGLFPEASFSNRAVIVSDTMRPRASTGIEFQVLMPVVNAPFRLYYAYNPMIVDTFLQGPVVSDRSYFANQQTFAQALARIAPGGPFRERRTLFRFSIGRTF